MNDDTISRAAAIECLERLSACDEPFVEIGTDDETFIGKYEAITEISDLPPAQPEPAIPLQWIEAQIEWLKSLDNAFSTLTAVQISVMVNKWKDEQDG